MVAPKFVYAKANGQTSVRAVFDRPMRLLGPDSDLDPTNPDVWTLSPSLPAIAKVLRTSLIEVELVFAEPAPLGVGYTAQVADTVQNATGESINPNFAQQTFDVTVADLSVSIISWVSPSILEVTFSAPIEPITFDSYNEVVAVQPTNGGRSAAVIGVQQSGAVLRVLLNAPGTSGASYSLELTRNLFVSQATGVILREGDQSQSFIGQGSHPYIVAASATQTLLQGTFSEALNFGTLDPAPGLPLFIGAYTASSGSLGRTVEAGTTPAAVSFPDAQLELGATVQWSVARSTRSVLSGSSFLQQASGVIGAGSETVAPGVTTLNKSSGAPYEVVFAGGIDTLPRTGRQLTTTLAFSFTPSAVSFPLVAFTLLNTQVSVVISKTPANTATIRIYRGANAIGEESAEFNPSAPFSLAITDATLDFGGFFSVSVNNVVLAGATSREILDPVLIDQNAGNTAVALTLGSPAAPTQVFSAAFSANINVSAFLTTGLRGNNSRDLLSFSSSQTAVTVAASPDYNGTPGFQNTGRAAFGVSATYLTDVDAVQVVVGLNEAAVIQSFTGSVSLLTGQQSVIDQVQFDQSTVLVEDKEVIVVFLHPKVWLGVQVGVTLDISGSEFSAVVPVVSSGHTPTTGQLTQQPASWYHQRFPQYPAGTSSYGPSVVVS